MELLSFFVIDYIVDPHIQCINEPCDIGHSQCLFGFGHPTRRKSWEDFRRDLLQTLPRIYSQDSLTQYAP